MLLMRRRAGIVSGLGGVLHGRMVHRNAVASMRRARASHAMRRTCAEHGWLDPNEDEPDGAQQGDQALRPMTMHSGTLAANGEDGNAAVQS